MNRLMKIGASVILGIGFLAHGGAARAEDTVIVTPAAPAPAPAPTPIVVVQPAPDPVVVAAPQTRYSETSTVNEGPRYNMLVVSGLVTFGVSYGAAVAVAATSDHQGDKRLYVPVVGPWLDLADRGSCTIGSSACDGETTSKVLIVVDGIFQGAGLLAVVGGVLAPGGSSSSHSTSTSVSRTGVHFAPVSFGAGAPGLAAFGQF
jgi:hypothetical protein